MKMKPIAVSITNEIGMFVGLSIRQKIKIASMDMKC